MTPQASFMILAAIVPARVAELRGLLESMNYSPGRVNTDNALLPFAQFDTIHFARLVIIDDQTLGDVHAYQLPVPAYPLYLAFLGDIDGDPRAFFEGLIARSANGLRQLFSCCEGFTTGAELDAWMERHRVSPAANYVNWRGRTVRRVREEAALHDELERYVETNATTLAQVSPTEIRAALRKHVNDIRLPLSEETPTPLGWSVANLLHLISLPLLLVFALPVFIPLAVYFVIRLRQLEKTDPELCARGDPKASAELAVIEDRDVTNQFTAMGSLKPGIVRRWTTIFALGVIDYGARHLFTRGGLARVRSIHFARWVFLDDRKRLIFFSNYDGSLESYMDDFINKVGFGLNVSFSNGIGYPRTNWLLLDGCADERKFKEFLRRHQLPTQVWYKAYPGLTAVDLEKNGRIREGLESTTMTDAELREWLALI